MRMRSSDLKRLAIERSYQTPVLMGTPPEVPKNLAATARNLGILIQWADISGVDGYNVVINSTQDFSNPDFQVRVAGETSREYFYQVGNVALTRYIAIQSYKGTRYSDLSSPVTVSTGVATSTSSFPGNVTFNNVETDLASVTITTTGNTLFVLGTAVFEQNGADKLVSLRLKEDGVTIRTASTIARNSGASTYGFQGTTFTFSTPSAASHTYKITAQNDTDAANCTASNIGIMAMEVPLLTSAATPPTAPSISPKSQTSQTVQTGSQRRGGQGTL